MALRILRIKDVQKATTLGRTSIYERMKRNEFPKPVSLGEKAVGWREDEIDAWIASLQRAQAESAA